MNSKVKTALLVAGGAVVGGLAVGMFMARDVKPEKATDEISISIPSESKAAVSVPQASANPQAPAKIQLKPGEFWADRPEFGGNPKAASKPAPRSQPQAVSPAQPRVNVEAIMAAARPQEVAKAKADAAKAVAVQAKPVVKQEAKPEVNPEPVKPEEKKGFWSRLFGS